MIDDAGGADAKQPNLRNTETYHQCLIWPGLVWSRLVSCLLSLVCPPLFLPSTVRMRKQPKAQNRGAAGEKRSSIIIITVLTIMEKQEPSPRLGPAPEFVFVTARLGPIRRVVPQLIDEPLGIRPLAMSHLTDVGPHELCTMYHVPTQTAKLVK